MGLPAEKRRYSIAEYLDLEEKAVDRHEFHDGEMLVMTGGTYRHSRINHSAGRQIANRLDGGPCFALDSNMRLRIGKRVSYVYPDTTIVCGEPEFDPDDPKQRTIVNPRVVIEVLSDSTESYDRGRKFDLYREIETLQEYVLVSQNEPLVETFLRQPAGGWLMNPWKGLENAVKLQSLDISVPLAEIYAGIEFDAPGAPVAL